MDSFYGFLEGLLFSIDTSKIMIFTATDGREQRKAPEVLQWRLTISAQKISQKTRDILSSSRRPGSWRGNFVSAMEFSRGCAHRPMSNKDDAEDPNNIDEKLVVLRMRKNWCEKLNCTVEQERLIQMIVNEIVRSRTRNKRIKKSAAMKVVVKRNDKEGYIRRLWKAGKGGKGRIRLTSRT